MTVLEKLSRLFDYISNIAANSSIATFLFNGKKVAQVSKVMYVRGFLTEAATDQGKILMEANKPKLGIRNFDGNKLDTGHSMVVRGIRPLYDTTLTASTEAALLGAAWKSAPPVSVVNGTIEIRQGGQRIFELTGTVLHNIKGVATSNWDDIHEIPPFILRPNVEIEIIYKQVGAPTANHAYSFELIGEQLIDAENYQ